LNQEDCRESRGADKVKDNDKTMNGGTETETETETGTETETEIEIEMNGGAREGRIESDDAL
jgi:hypothetical protein